MDDTPVAEDALVVIRGNDRIGPYSPTELGELLEDGVVLAEDLCCPEDRPSKVRPVAWWLAQVDDVDRAQQTEVKSRPAPRLISEPIETKPASSGDPLFEGKVPLGGDTPVERRDPPKHVEAPVRERVVYRGRPTILKYAKWLIVIALLGIGSMFLGRFGDIFPIIGWTVAIIAAIGLTFERYTKLYVVSDQRVELIEGLIATSSREVRIRDIRAINVSRTGVLGLLGVGTVEFASAGSDEVEVAFADVARATKVKLLVRKLQQDSDG